MSSIKRLMLAGLAAVCVTASAHAADMPRYPTDPLPLPPPEKPYLVEEFVSGVYLRGDLGYRLDHVGSATYLGAPVSNNKLDNVGLGGLGAGYKARWFRFDVTADYAPRGQYSGSLGAATLTGKIDSYTVMLNGYFDLGTWHNVTPYIGAGVGGAYLSFSSFDTLPAGMTAPPTVRQWNVAYAGMAGVSFNLSHNVLMDISYRHIFLGDANSSQDTPTGLTVKNISGDEVRLGIRYLLD
jgi:opacity protein-like surface antigen